MSAPGNFPVAFQRPYPPCCRPAIRQVVFGCERKYREMRRLQSWFGSLWWVGNSYILLYSVESFCLNHEGRAENGELKFGR